MLPLPEDGTPHHVCMDVVAQNGKPRPDLADSPLVEPDLLLFTDGSSYYLNGHRVSGYSVTSQADVIEAAPLPPSFSAQGAELHALTRACLLSSGKTVTIYTDSKYAFGVCHATGQLWKQRGFLTSSGTKIANGPLISALLEAIQAPRQVAVVHCYAHRQSNSVVSQGNALADSAAKAEALQFLAPALLAWPSLLRLGSMPTQKGETLGKLPVLALADGLRRNAQMLRVSPPPCYSGPTFRMA
ncbi:unnamed protein product [Lepidochelys kempii]